MSPKPKRSIPPLKKRLLIYGLIVSAVVALFVVPVLIAWAVPLGDFAPVEPVPSIRGVVIPLRPDPQLEKHTCGFNAISAIYRSYGLDPEERHLRYRLGVDQTAWIYDSETLGSIQPDIYRVLAQDGFNFVTPDAAQPEAIQMLKSHLIAGRYALALIQRRQNGNMHWVVLAGLKNGSLQVCDSLAPAIYDEDLDDFWNRCVLSVTLLTPAETVIQPSVWKLHVAGAKDGYRAFVRKRAVSPISK